MLMRCLQVIVLLTGICCSCMPAHAQSAFYVASTGLDTNDCSRTSPCVNLSHVLSVAPVNATIVCLDTVIGSILAISKSVDIDCSAARHVIRDPSAAGGLGAGMDASIQINIAVDATDPSRTVRLRGISVVGVSGTAQFLPRCIDIISAAVVYIEGMVITDCFQQGIYDHRTGGQTKLFVKDTIVRNTGGAGIVAASAAVGITVLDNVTSENNAYGIAAATGNNVAIRNSVFSGNSTAGVEGDSGAQIILDSSTVTHNNIGVQSVFSVRLSNNNIAFNNTAASGSSGSFGNNRFSGNASIGTAPTPLGGASSDVGQQ